MAELEGFEKGRYGDLGVGKLVEKAGAAEAIKGLDKGIFPGGFCVIIELPEELPESFRNEYALILHADGVGTKGNVAYLSKMEGLGNHWYRRLAQDAVVMNTDDMMCSGITNETIIFSNHLAINSNRFRKEDGDIAAAINGYPEYFKMMKEYGVNMKLYSGETASLGSYISTFGMDATAVAFIKKSKIIDCSRIAPNQIIVGLASSGQCKYEDRYNAGMRSNGYTSGISGLLHPYYRKYLEVINSATPANKVFTGEYYLNDILRGTNVTAGEALLSPTRSYLPVLIAAEKLGIDVVAMFHCSGGGLTKSIDFGNNIRYVKNNLFDIPPVMSEIKRINNDSDREMYVTFNMGVGMEALFDNIEEANKFIEVAISFGIDAQVIGFTETVQNCNEVVIENKGKQLIYTKRKSE